MGFQIGDRVRTRTGDYGIVRAIHDPQQIHVTLGEGMAESVQAFAPEELVLAQGASMPTWPEELAQDAEGKGPAPESGRGRRGRRGAAAGADAGAADAE